MRRRWMRGSSAHDPLKERRNGSAMRDVWIAGSLLWLAGVSLRLSILAVPPLVRAWLPQRVRLGTALFPNGVLVGETLPVMLTIPLVLPLVGASWRWALAMWGVPLVLIALLTLALAPAREQAASAAPASGWWPDWRNPLTWQIGVLFGSVNGVYFCSNAFLPGYLTDAGRPDLISAALTALNFGQLPASFLLLATANGLLGALGRFLFGVPCFACGLGESSWRVVF